MPWVLNMPDYVKVLNMAEFFNMQVLRSILNIPEYAFIEF